MPPASPSLDSPVLTAVSVFSGAGGLDLGASRAGMALAYATDSMPDAKISHERLLADVPEYYTGPIAKVTALPSADVLLGGYPCQPFSMGGPRRPTRDPRSELFRDFARCLDLVRPRFFVAENVPGLHALGQRGLLETHLNTFATAGDGYVISYAVLKAEDFGVPQRRRRLIMVGVRRDQERYFHFPLPDHTPEGSEGTKPFVAHGPILAGLPAWPEGDFYQRDRGQGEDWPWYYMSRNRKAPWFAPSYTILANARHTPIHPGSPVMRQAWSDLADGYKQGWEFGDTYDSPDGPQASTRLERARRMSWQECALVQRFPADFEPSGNLMRKVELIGNAVPPLLAEAVCRALVDGSGLQASPPPPERGELWSPLEAASDPSEPAAPQRSRRRAGDRTKPPLADQLRRALLDRRGYRLKHTLYLTDTRVTIDIAYTKLRLAVFVDGCFWHGCPEHGPTQQDDDSYWTSRLTKNIRRDRVVDNELAELGWTVVRIWEHEDPKVAATLVSEVYQKLATSDEP